MSTWTYVTGPSYHKFLTVQKFHVVTINPVENLWILSYRCPKLFPVPRILKPLVVNVVTHGVRFEICVAWNWSRAWDLLLNWLTRAHSYEIVVLRFRVDFACILGNKCLWRKFYRVWDLCLVSILCLFDYLHVATVRLEWRQDLFWYSFSVLLCF